MRSRQQPAQPAHGGRSATHAASPQSSSREQALPPGTWLGDTLAAAALDSPLPGLARLMHDSPRVAQMSRYASAMRAASPRPVAVVQRVGGQTIGYDPDLIQKPAFKTNVKSLFDLARELNRLRKRLVTHDNLTKVSALPEKQRGPQVKGAYAFALTRITLDIPWLQTTAANGAIVDQVLADAKRLGFVSDVRAGQIKSELARLATVVRVTDKDVRDSEWKKKDGGRRPIAPLLTGAAAFVKKPGVAPDGLHREVFKKLGKDDGEHNEYVTDDFGVHTRRYAYMEKSYHQWTDYKRTGFLTGKTQELMAAATGRAADTISPTNFDAQHLTADEGILRTDYGARGDAIVLALAHQWKGSGPGQRGLSLTSTPKDDAVFGNAGDSFKSADGAKFKIDLARIDARTSRLINHYAPGSATRAALGPARDDADRRLLGAVDRRSGRPKEYQYERSVLKNRELYLDKLTPAAVVSVTAHDATMSVDRDAATFNDYRSRAIESGRVRRELDAANAMLAEQQAALQGATQTRADAAAAVNTATADSQHAAGRKRFFDGKPDVVQVGRNRTIRAFVYWRNLETAANGRIAAAVRQRDEAARDIAALQGAIRLTQQRIVQLTAALQAAPVGGNVHATRGWETGQAYNAGYLEGMKAKARVKDDPARVREIFSRAYNDDTKYTPYWQGFGAALRS